MTRNHHTDPDPTPAHGIERPADPVDQARARAEAEWQWPAMDRMAGRRNHTTWSDVARLATDLDSAATAAGHPAPWGRIHLVIPTEIGEHARLERHGSDDRIPGGSILAATADESHRILATRIAIYRDIADAQHHAAVTTQGRVYTFPRHQS